MRVRRVCCATPFTLPAQTPFEHHKQCRRRDLLLLHAAGNLAGAHSAIDTCAGEILAPRHGFELALTPRENSRNDDIRLRWDSLPGTDLCSYADESSVHVPAAT